MSSKNTIDITKTGPQSFKQLQNANNDPFTAVRPKIVSQFDINDQAEQMVSSPLADTKTAWGQSMFDNKSASADDFQNLQDIRANNQPWYAKAAAGVAKGAITAGTTFVSGIVGIPFGIGSAIYNGKLSKVWDNAITKVAADLNEQAEDWLPNYYTKEQEEGPWYSSANLLSANFLFDKVIKNIGFTIGAAYSGGIYTKAISAVARGLGGMYAFAKTGKSIEEAIELGKRAMDMSTAARYTKGLVGAGFSAMGEGAIEAINNSKNYVNTNKQKVDALSAEEYNNALHSFIDAGGRVDENSNPILGNDVVSKAFQARVRKIQEAKDAAYKQIEDTRVKMGNADFIANIPLLTAGNILTFGKMWMGGFKSERTIQKTITRATKEAKAAAKEEGKEAVKRLKDVVKKAKKTGYQGLTEEEKALVEEGTSHLLGPKMHALAMAAREPLKEGNEEMSQSAIAKASDNYWSSRVDYIYDATLNGESRKKVLDEWKASIQGFKDIYGDFNNYEEGFIGALTGLMGSPTFGRKNNNTSETYLGRSKWLGMSGGVIPQWRNAIKEREHEADIVSHVNSILKSGNLERNMKHLIAQTTFDDRMKKAVIMGDKLDYKDSELASAFESIMYLKEAKKEDLLKNAIKFMDDFTEEDAEKVLEYTSSTIGLNGNDISNKIEQKNKNILEIKSLQEEIQKDRESFLVYWRSLKIIGDKEIDKKQRVEELIQAKEDRISELQKESENLESEIEESHPITVSPYVKEDGELMSTSEVLDNLNEKKDKFKKILDYVEKTIYNIDDSTSNVLTNEQLKTLTWYKTLQHDWQERANSMGSEISKYIKGLLNNSSINDAIEKIDGAIQGIEPNELESQDKVIYGGMLVHRNYLHNLKNYISSVLEILQNIDRENEDGGLALARLLNNNTEIIRGKDKDEKKAKLGDYLYDFITNAINNIGLSEDEVKAFTTILTDLKRLGANYNRYNELLKEYINHPEKIDAAHASSLAEAEAKHRKDKLDSTNRNIRFNGTIGATAKDMKANKINLDEEGTEGWFGTLTPEQQERGNAAIKLIKGIDALTTLAEGNENENIDNLLNEVIDKEIENVDNIDELLDILQKKGSYGEEIDSILKDVNDDLAALDAKEELEAKFRDFINSDEVSKIADSLDDIEKHSQEKQDAYIEEAAKAMDEKEDSKKDDGLDDKIPEGRTPHVPKEKETHVPKERSIQGKSKVKNNNLRNKKAENRKKTINTKTSEENPAEKNSVDEDKSSVEKQGSSNDIVARNNRRRKLGYSTAYSNRPQLSEVFMYGRDLQSYVDYIKEHPERIPKYTKSKLFLGITNQKEFDEAFTKYIEATHKYLTEHGAFDYVKHYLKHGDKLIFTIDKDLNEAAGVPVVVIKAVDSEGNSHVVGTMKSELDFMSINNRTDKAYGETESGQKALYDDIVNKYNALSEEEKSNDFIGNTSTVSILMGGDIAFSNTESKISSIFEGTGDEIIFGVVREENGSLAIKTGDAEQDKKVLDISNGKKGQVYVLIPSNNGSLVPALCYGTPLLELLGKSDDWYINQIVQSIQDIIPKLQDTTGVNTLGAIKSEIAKWLGVNNENLHINLAYKNAEGKEVQTTDLNKADRVSIKYSLNSSDEKIVSTILLEDDKSISKQKALNVVTRIVSEVSKSTDPELQVNLSFTQMGKDSARGNYYGNMANYYHTNIVQGQTHTVNDWFTYDKTDVEEEHRPSKSKRVVRPTPTAPVNRGSRPQRKVISKKTNKEVEISEGGQVTDENGKTIVEEEKQEILKEEQESVKEGNGQTQEESKTVAEEPNVENNTPEEASNDTEFQNNEPVKDNNPSDTKDTSNDTSIDNNNSTEDSNNTETTESSVHIDNDNKSLLGNMILGKSKRKKKTRNRKQSDEDNNQDDNQDDNNSNDNSSTPNTENSQDTPYVKNRRTRSKRKSSSNSDIETSNTEYSTENPTNDENTNESSEIVPNNKMSTREKSIELSRKIFMFDSEVKNTVESFINRVFDYLENNKEQEVGIIKAINIGLDIFVDSTDWVVNKMIFNNFISKFLDNKEKEILEREAANEFSNDDTKDAFDNTIEALQRYMQGYRNLKSKALAKVFQKISKVMEGFNKNKLLTQNFFNGLAVSTKNGIDSMLHSYNNLSDKYSYNNLSNTIKEYLNKRNISKQEYINMSPKQQEALIRCMI